MIIQALHSNGGIAGGNIERCILENYMHPTYFTHRHLRARRVDRSNTLTPVSPDFPCIGYSFIGMLRQTGLIATVK